MNTTAPAVDGSLMLQWIIGTVVVLFYARDRFKNPSPTRATTTFLRYWAASVGYTVAMLMLFVFIGGGFTAIDLRAVEPLFGKVPEDMGGLPGPLLSALVLTSLLPHFPLLATFDERIKRFFWRVGNIPSEVRLLGRQLAGATYRPKAVRAIEHFSLNHAWLEEHPESLRFRWARCIALLAEIERWKSDRVFAHYVEENKAALDALHARLRAIALDERAFCELGHSTESTLLAGFRKNVEIDLTTTWASLCDFVAGGVLGSRWNDAQRRSTVVELGFEGLPPPARSLNPHDIVLVVGLVFIAMLFIPLMMRRFFYDDLLPPQVRVLVMVPIIYAIAIVVAIFPKGVWPFASRVANGARPYAAYALSGVVAAFSALFISTLFRFAFDAEGNVIRALSTHGAFGDAWRTSLDRWPWLLMAFFATVTIAWQADNLAGSGSAARWLRWIEAFVSAAVFGTAQWVVLQLLAQSLPQPAAAAMVVATPQLLLTSSVVGFCIGLLVPSLYRARGPATALPPASATPARFGATYG